MPVVQRIERLVAVQVVGGSIPLGHALKQTWRSARVVYLAGLENRADLKDLQRFESSLLRYEI